MIHYFSGKLGGTTVLMLRLYDPAGDTSPYYSGSAAEITIPKFSPNVERQLRDGKVAEVWDQVQSM